MIHEEKKVVKIIEELTMFFFGIGANKIQSSITRDGNLDIIEFCSNYNPEFTDELEDLKQYLTEEKNDGLEDIYWELAGSGDPGESGQLLLIGMMIDKAEIAMKDDTVKLKLWKVTKGI